MPTQSDEIFYLKDEKFHALPARSMRSGLLGKSLEDALQTLLQKYPQILPGKQIDPASDDPPRFVLLRREMPVGGWSLDHLYVDQRGILTLVETKLMQNPESRREVIGQIIEYASNAIESWASGRARQYASEFWSKQGKELNEVLLERFKNLEIEDFWHTVETNLRHSRMRLIIAADELRPEVRRMIEYLNKEMQNTEVLGLEVKCYGDDSTSLVLVPRLIGQTQANADRRVSGKEIYLWTVDRLKHAFQSLPNEEGEALKRILEWALGNGCYVESKAQTPTFGLTAKNNTRIFSVLSSGYLYLYFEVERYPGGIKERDALLSELKPYKIFDQYIDPNIVVSGRNSIRKLWELDKSEIDNLLDILGRYCG